MDLLDSCTAILESVSNAIQIYQNQHKKNTEWEAEKLFCTELGPTLDAIMLYSPVVDEFSYAQQLNFCINSTRVSIFDFHSAMRPCVAEIQKLGNGARTVLPRAEQQLRVLAIPLVQRLKKQIDESLPTLNTLILLYAM
jgi:hypothetical protein